MAGSDDLIRAARSSLTGAPAGPEPSRRAAVITCMDARIDPWRIFEAGPGEIHVLRNAGAIVTDDVVRSLVVSQRMLGTRTVHLVMHTGCGMIGLDETSLRETLLAESGSAPDHFGGFDDLEAEVRRGMGRLTETPWLVTDTTVRGYVYDIVTARLGEVKMG